MNLAIRPILTWPGVETTYPQRSNFDTTYSKTLLLLDRELGMLKGHHPVVELYVDDYDIKLDGELRASSRPRKPGVVLHFESKHGPLRYACDKFDHWHHNLRAIALALEALRKVDRYGIGTGHEQYAGYRALPAGSIALGSGMTQDDAVRFLCEHAPIATPQSVLAHPEAAYRIAARTLHPDAPGGSPELFQRLTEARTVLTKGA